MRNLIVKMFKAILLMLLILIISVVGFYLYLQSFYSKPTKIDDRGRLYYIDYTGDYYSKFVTGPFGKLKPVINTGCSAFYTANKDGGFDTARNYDLAHLDKDGNTTGLNVIVKCTPKGKYRSIGIADFAMFSYLKLDYTEASFDDKKFSDVLLALAPYICVDGINEKGVVCTIHALDLKEGETSVNQNDPGKDSVIITELLRLILDNCASVDEAVDLANNKNLINTFDADFHMFVTDANGKSAVLEWRYNKLEVTYTDIITNFYVNSDDAEDCYIDGKFKETYVPPVANKKGYRFGYGHGYERFKTLMSGMETFESDGKTVMDMNDMMNLLEDVSQEYTGELTSLTQYSVIYHNSEPSMDICVYPDYTKMYNFNPN